MMLPKQFTFDVDKTNQVISWIMHEQFINKDEAEQAREAIEALISSTFVKGACKVFADHRQLEETGKQARLPMETSQESGKLMAWLSEYCSSVAVICGSMMMQSQMNRLATSNGLDSKLKAFWASTPGKAVADAQAFLNITDNKLIKG
ncbi:hypothetical protein [Paenibacillus taihuensis]|nr:hypothetical protein [Paenibacillus taihuensis]